MTRKQTIQIMGKQANENWEISKDWKMVTSRREYTHFINVKDHARQIIVNTLYPKWYVFVRDYLHNEEASFKNKPSALKFAKEYMRTH